MRIFTVLTAFIMGMGAIHVTPAQADIAPLFSLKGATCGTASDWKGMALSYGEDVGLEGVSFSLLADEDNQMQLMENLSYTLVNNRSSAFPVHATWEVMRLVSGNLLPAAITGVVARTTLLRPGPNTQTVKSIPLVGLDEVFACLTLNFED